MTTIETPPGLRGVVVSDTAVGDVRGDEGWYHYRGYDATRLAREHSFDEASVLVLEGHLPSADELAAHRARLADARVLADAVADLLPALAGGRPLAGLQAALTALEMTPTRGASPERRRDDARRVCAVTPVVLAALYRTGQGLDPVAPRPDLHGAAQWLFLLSGADPDPMLAAALEPYLVATIDHGFNASTFTARVAASAGSDVASAVVAAIATFVGPLHGGAPDRALDALDAIGTPERAATWVAARLDAGERIMGFGHAVYRTEDPRARMLREIATGLRDRDPALVDLALAVERTVEDVLAQRRPDRVLRANVEFWAGVVMALCGVPRTMFTPTFTVSRVVGWCAHVLEQSAGGTLFRPSARYVGRTDLDQTRLNDG